MIGALWGASALVLAGSHACRAVEGDHIRMRDIAAVEARFASLDLEQNVGFAPQPGAKRVFWPAELASIAKRNGVSGEEGFRAICFEQRMRLLPNEDIVEALRSWLPAGAQVDILERSKAGVPNGILRIPKPQVFIHSGDGVLLRGWVEFGAQRRFPVWARVRMRLKQNVVLAAEEIAAATQIQKNQLRVEEREIGVEDLPVAEAEEQVDGRFAKRRIGQGGVITLAALEQPKQVAPGATVKVEVRDGGALLAFDALAENGGRTGDTITVRNPSSGRAFPARITGENAVLVTPRGARLTTDQK